MCTHQAHNKHTDGTSKNGVVGESSRFSRFSKNYKGNLRMIHCCVRYFVNTSKFQNVKEWTKFFLLVFIGVPHDKNTTVVLLARFDCMPFGGFSSTPATAFLFVPAMCLMCAHNVTWGAYNSKVWTFAVPTPYRTYFYDKKVTVLEKKRNTKKAA